MSRFPRAPLARFFLLGPVGHALGALQYALLLRINPLDGARAWTTWCCSSALGIAWIHALHCRFTFGRRLREAYFPTLPRAYLLQGTSALAASLIVVALARIPDLHPLVPWAGATVAASALNFLGLSRLLGQRSLPMTYKSACLAPLSATLTIVVPTKNESANIGAFLSSLLPEIALIVVDASDDETPEIVQRMRPERTRVVRAQGNIAHARQLGAELAATEWVLFTDADVRFAPGYFEALAACQFPPGTGALYGCKDSPGSHPVYHSLFRAGQGLCTALGIPAGSGSNMLVRREALRAAGGFDLELNCNEDSELLWRVADSGHGVRFAPELRVHSTDDRRLARGSARKLLHSALRCALLYTELLPRRWRTNDWGYWSR